MPTFSLVIAEDAQALHDQLLSEREPERKRRLQALHLIASGQAQGPTAVAKHLAIHRNTATSWFNKYRQGGLKALLATEQRGPKPGSQRIMPEAAFDALKQRLLQNDGLDGYEALRQWLLDEWGVKVSYKGLYDLVRYRLGAKLKVPRPEHPKKV